MAEPSADDAPPFAIPEVTRALRVLGARRGQPGADHDRFFAPLLAPLKGARDHLARGTDRPWAAAAYVDAAAMAAGVRAALDALAAAHGGSHPPDQRALHAELDELTGPLHAALGTLGETAAALAVAGEAARPAAWRAWAAALARVFAAADGAWAAMLPVLADPRGGAGRLWRNVLRGPAPVDRGGGHRR